MPRKGKKYHYIYKTTNIINKKFYIGMHTTNDLNDGYVGSGKRLWYSIKKYGKESFIVEILEFHNNRDSLKIREKEIISKELLDDPMCMNLCYGGGGWPNNGKQIGGDSCTGANRYWNIPENRERKREIGSRISKRNWELGIFKHIDYWTDRRHSSETIEKMKGHKRQCGELNSQYGKTRSEEVKSKIKESVNRYLQKDTNLGYKEIKKLKNEKEKLNYTFNGVYFNKLRRQKIKTIFGIDLENDFNLSVINFKNVIDKLYTIEKKSTNEIANIFKTNNETIRNYLILFNINRRTLLKSHWKNTQTFVKNINAPVV